MCKNIVGRADERQAVETAVGRAAAGRGGVVVVAGPPGIGKSRLARYTAVRAAAAGLTVVAGRATELRVPLPYQPLTDTVLAGWRMYGRPPPEERAGLGAGLARLDPDGAEAGPAEDPEAVAAALLATVEALGRRHGALVLLEDLQWAAPETAAVVDCLAGQTEAHPVLVLVTTREVPGPTATALELHPLSEAEVATMVPACLTDRRATDLAPLVARHSGGVPLLVEDLISAWLVGPDAAQSLDSLPGTFADSVRQRIEVLRPDERRVVETAAVLGAAIDWTLVARATGLPDDMVDEGLAQGAARQLLVADGADIRFRHALTRDTVLAGIQPDRRTVLAGAALDAVEATHTGLPAGWCAVAAHLAEEAGRAGRAATLLEQTARESLRAGGPRSARTARARAESLAGA
jgi:predicted ATPase